MSEYQSWNVILCRSPIEGHEMCGGGHRPWNSFDFLCRYLFFLRFFGSVCTAAYAFIPLCGKGACSDHDMNAYYCVCDWCLSLTRKVTATRLMRSFFPPSFFFFLFCNVRHCTYCIVGVETHWVMLLCLRCHGTAFKSKPANPPRAKFRRQSRFVNSLRTSCEPQEANVGNSCSPLPGI